MPKERTYTQEEKFSIVEEAKALGLAVVIPRHKISYKLFRQWQEELASNQTQNSATKTIITSKKATSILTPGKGFMDTYDYTLNPYSGCVFGCTYCYAAFFSRSQDLQKNWGHWVHIKENALDLLIKFRKKSLTGKSIYMSSVTDPYQPVERKLNLTRSLLEELAEFHQPRLVIQTRSPLVTRDIDLFSKFTNIQVNMTITTDSERVRKVFEPLCPSNELRLKAIKEVHKAGINACITMTPLLPVENANEFGKQLKDTGIKRFIIQPFHSDKGKFVASTGEKATQLLKDLNWNGVNYRHTLDTLRKHIPEIGLGKEGFKPI